MPTKRTTQATKTSKAAKATKAPKAAKAPAVPRSRYVTVEGMRLHYLDWPSDGPAVVCLHGAGGSAKQWVYLASQLHPNLRIIALDQRGYGDSDTPAGGYEFKTMARDVEMFVDAIGLEKFYLLGHSMGSRVSIVYAGRNSHRLHKLVLSDPPHYPVEDKVMRELAEVNTRPKRFASRAEAVDYLSKMPFRGPAPTGDALERMADARFVQHSDGSLTWGWDNSGILHAMAFMLGDIPMSLPKIACPTLVLHGVRSHLLTAEDAQHTVAAIRNAELVSIDAGHGLWRDNPEASLKAVREFVLGK